MTTDRTHNPLAGPDKEHLRSVITGLIRDHVGGRPSQIFAASDAITIAAVSTLLPERSTEPPQDHPKTAREQSTNPEQVIAELVEALEKAREAIVYWMIEGGAPAEIANKTLEAFDAALSKAKAQGAAG